MDKFEIRPASGARRTTPGPGPAVRPVAASPALPAGASETTAHASRLGAFIRSHLGEVVAAWESFARTLDVSRQMSPEALRDHGKAMLRVVADELDASPPTQEISTRSWGHADPHRSSDRAAASHGASRQLSGFDPVKLVSELGALRASVLSLWQKSAAAGADPLTLEDHLRFNQAIDRALAASVKSYAANVASSRDMFLAILGHDLRGPLAAIRMSALVLGKVGLGEAPRLMAAARVDRAARQMGHLIQDLQEFTRSRLGGGIPIQRAACDVGLVCADVIESVVTTHAGLALKFQPLGDLVVMADEDRLQQVVSNLLHNAVQHGDPLGEVSLLARGDVDEVMVQVRNSGRPIPDAALPFLFEPLVQAAPEDEAPADQRSGTSQGLGLFIAREIVQGHGGTITVASEGRAGTVFSVRLPRDGTSPPPYARGMGAGRAGSVGRTMGRW